MMAGLHRGCLALLLGSFLACPALADALAEEPGGDLNPPEMSLDRVLRDTARGEVTMMNCASGYFMTKSGDHAAAREVFGLCAERGWTGAMTWMSALEDNGLGAVEDPAAAAEWDRRAAEAGDPVGQFNRGLDLLRGRGGVRDIAQGQAMIDRAARAGLPQAQELQGAHYDWRAVTPDADEARYLPQG
ncbi:sel1 repeat family protein [Thioclava sp. FTW29]|uniref:Sel1 repeat family protein n=1 Tax=Thioclava litoralis TaxID=3076557 RepID=A0ABZ1E3S8_9RHOB|nr:sel1 repeat family protein [Thioclava sp. FTW29]